MSSLQVNFYDCFYKCLIHFFILSINLIRSTNIDVYLKNEWHQPLVGPHTLQRLLNYFEGCSFLFNRTEFHQLFLQKALPEKALQQKPAEGMTLPHFWLMGSKERQTILSRNAQMGSHYSQVLGGTWNILVMKLKYLFWKYQEDFPARYCRYWQEWIKRCSKKTKPNYNFPCRRGDQLAKCQSYLGVSVDIPPTVSREKVSLAEQEQCLGIAVPGF